MGRFHWTCVNVFACPYVHVPVYVCTYVPYVCTCVHATVCMYSTCACMYLRSTSHIQPVQYTVTPSTHILHYSSPRHKVCTYALEVHLTYHHISDITASISASNASIFPNSILGLAK